MLSIKILKYINEYKLFNKKDKIILAISGGADSVCLMYILMDLDFSFELAHCNYGLRGKESEDDELFVKRLAQKYRKQLHIKHFKTKEYSVQRKISIQMAARDLRYCWFNSLLESRNARYIAIAHQKDDVIETFFINLIRGTGILGLSSISNKRSNIVRPLINISRVEVENYLKEKNYNYRHDSSNNETYYIRNKLRHKILPLIDEVNPSFRENFACQIQKIQETNEVFSQQIDTVRKDIVQKTKGVISLKINKIKKLYPRKIYLFELLKPFGFNQINSINKALDTQSGKQFFSSTHNLLIDREDIFIIRNESDNIREYKISRELISTNYPLKMNFKLTVLTELIKNARTAQFDYEKLSFPLKIRKWQAGDKFMPLGMKKHKKLSDFFIDNKFSLIQKRECWLLCSCDKIIWIIGYRIDDRFKVDGNTKKVYIAELLEN